MEIRWNLNFNDFKGFQVSIDIAQNHIEKGSFINTSIICNRFRIFVSSL